MALPSNLVPGLLPSEVEFVATSSVEINVVPLMRIDKVRLLGGVYGPLRPPAQARLPLWLALNLKMRKRCKIVCPDWMEPENLRMLHREETMNEAFAPVPLHYNSIAKVLLESASDDIPNSDEVRAYLKSLREARQSKILSGLDAINSEHLNMTNISLGEVTELRDFLTTAFNHLRTIQGAAEGEGGAGGEEPSGQFVYNIREPGTGTQNSSSEARVTSQMQSRSEGETMHNNNMDLF